jgi:hypothetical protein
LLQIAAQNFHKGRFAATIRADQPIAVAVAKFDRHVFKQGLRPKLHGDIRGGKHDKLNLEKFWSAILTLRAGEAAVIQEFRVKKRLESVILLLAIG